MSVVQEPVRVCTSCTVSLLVMYMGSSDCNAREWSRWDRIQYPNAYAPHGEDREYDCNIKTTRMNRGNRVHQPGPQMHHTEHTDMSVPPGVYTYLFTSDTKEPHWCRLASHFTGTVYIAWAGAQTQSEPRTKCLNRAPHRPHEASQTQKHLENILTATRPNHIQPKTQPTTPSRSYTPE